MGYDLLQNPSVFPYGVRPILQLRPDDNRESGFQPLSSKSCQAHLLRWVQDSRTYSTRHSWYAFTSDSGFMQSSCRLQSELRPSLMRLAPPRGLATHCLGHCIMSVAQGIKGSCWFGVILTSFPFHGTVSCDTCNAGQGLRSLPHWRERLTARADDNHATPVIALPCGKLRPFRQSIRLQFQALVRFLVCHRIKRHDPPLVRVPVYSFEF